MNEIKQFINKYEWTFAKTYANTYPHEYLVLRNVKDEDKDMFYKLVNKIFDDGYEDNFYDLKNKYLIIGDHKYWSCDKTPETTILINRAIKHIIYPEAKQHGPPGFKSNDTEIIVDVETTGLDPTNSELTAIGININGKITLFCRDKNKITEKVILEQFWDKITEYINPVMIGFNFLFDINFLRVRSQLHDVTQPVCSFSDAEVRLRDMRLILNPDKYAKGTLTTYCKKYGIADGDTTTGKEMIGFWNNNELDKIAVHLRYDVEKELELWNKIKEGVSQYE